MSGNGFTREEIGAWASRIRHRFVELLREFVEVPSVSMEPERKPEMGRMAELAAATLRELGFETRIIPTDGNPIVHGKVVVDPAWPTVTVYNHMDVQPGGAKEEWRTEPFLFVEDGDKWIGRGTTDDKGPGLTALFAARYALDHGARVNVSFLWELEEEIGSPNFEKAIVREASSLATDCVVVSDTIWITRGRPACPAGLRGLQGFLLKLETGATDQHSGVTGGAARNPLAELIKVVAAMLDGDTGKVKIPGFYDDVVKPTAKELRDFERSGFSVKTFMKDHEFKSIRTKDAMEVMKRIWAMPTLEVHGLTGGYAGPGVKTVIPPRGEMKLTTRLVPDQDPKKIVKLVTQFVKKLNKDVQVIPQGTLAPYRGVTEGPLADGIRSAMKFAFGREPVFVREGGSIGAVPTMEKVLKCPVLFLGLSLPEHGYHAPNENYDWEQASGGMAAFAKLFETYGKR
jgi:acetylornithine deacetylase/succinyl-diaminopimelate desuccinylase-like protein